MTPTPTDEIKAVRHRLGAEFDYDLHRIIAEIQKRQKESGREYIRLPKREPRIAAAQGAVVEKVEKTATEAVGTAVDSAKKGAEGVLDLLFGK